MTTLVENIFHSDRTDSVRPGSMAIQWPPLCGVHITGCFAWLRISNHICCGQTPAGGFR